MTIRKGLICAFLVGLTTYVVVLARHESTLIKSQPQAKSIPDPVLYAHLFRHVNLLKRKATEEERAGHNGDELRMLYKNQAALNEKQAASLDEIAAECERRVSELDAKAKVIIDQLKERFPGGKVPDGEQLPPPPLQLKTLSDERTWIILAGRDSLRAAYGEQEFARFDQFVKRHTKADLERPSDAQRFRPLAPTLPKSLIRPGQ